MQTAIDHRSTTPKGRRQRERILEAAEAVFASHGFHGASMRDLAAAAGVPLATCVYHFARKEQLYAAVLAAIADQLAAEVPAREVRELVRALVRWALGNPQRVKLLLRELLDNPARVAKAARLPLAPFLSAATAVVGDEIAVMHVVGGISYVVAAQPTVDRIVGVARAERLAATVEHQAVTLALRTLGIAP
jgi:AcrR family transcriptional regulator